MRLEDLEELYSWMLEKRVLHVSAEGITLTLDVSALPVVLMARPEGATDPEEDDGEQESPQAKIRREFEAGLSPDSELD